MTVGSISIRSIAGWVAVGIPSTASAAYILFPDLVAHVVRQTCGAAPVLCVASGYYTDAAERTLFDMQTYGTALEELRRITPILYVICVLAMIVPLLYSATERRRSGVGKILLGDVRKPNGWLVILLTLAVLLLFAYVLFVSRSLLFIDVDSYFRLMFTAPVSIAAYWSLFLLLVVGGAIAAELVLTSLSAMLSRRDRG